MTQSKSPRDYTLASPGAGAYRVQLVGQDPRDVASAVFAGAVDTQSVSLPPGKYTAFIEPLGSTQRLIQIVNLAAQTAPIRLRDNLSETTFAATPTATIRRSRLGGEEELATDVVSTRRFEIGISVDRMPGAFGGWEARRPRLSIAEQQDGGIAMVLRRPSDWKEFPRWRLTIAVENDPLWRVRFLCSKAGFRFCCAPSRLRPDQTSPSALRRGARRWPPWWRNLRAPSQKTST